jgi:hypothetical protein
VSGTFLKGDLLEKVPDTFAFHTTVDDNTEQSRDYPHQPGGVGENAADSAVWCKSALGVTMGSSVTEAGD